MADPLSTGTAIVAIASTGFALAKALHEYSTSVRGAPAEIRRVAREVDYTARVLRQVHRRLPGPGDGEGEGSPPGGRGAVAVSAEGLADLEEVVRGCRDAFEEVAAAVRPFMGKPGQSSSAALSWRKQAEWPFQKKKIEELRANLERLKMTLLLMLSVIAYSERMQATDDSSMNSAVDDTVEKLQMLTLLKARKDANGRYEDLITGPMENEEQDQNAPTIGNPAPMLVTTGSETDSMSTTSKPVISPVTSTASRPPTHTSNMIPPAPPRTGSGNTPTFNYPQGSALSSQLAACSSAVSDLSTTVGKAQEAWETFQIFSYDDISLRLDRTVTSAKALRKAHEAHRKEAQNASRKGRKPEVAASDASKSRSALKRLTRSRDGAASYAERPFYGSSPRFSSVRPVAVAAPSLESMDLANPGLSASSAVAPRSAKRSRVGLAGRSYSAPVSDAMDVVVNHDLDLNLDLDIDEDEGEDEEDEEFPSFEKEGDADDIHSVDEDDRSEEDEAEFGELDDLLTKWTFKA